jgi:peroxiredoxin Q/BCP
MDFIIRNIWLILFVIWGLPLGFYRSKFRKLVYQTDSWLINIKPVFWKEIKGLFGNIYPDNQTYKKFRNFYKFQQQLRKYEKVICGEHYPEI